MVLPPILDFAKDPDASPDRMNKVAEYIVARFKALEVPAKSAETMLAQLQAIGLQRIADALAPVYAELVSLSQLGAIFTAPSSSTVSYGPGTRTFIVAEESRRTFAAAAYVSAVEVGNVTRSLSGRLLSYDRSTGTLTLLVDQFTGEEGASASAWTLTASVDFAQLRTFVLREIAALRGSASEAAQTLGQLEATDAANLDTALAATAALSGAVSARIDALSGTIAADGDAAADTAVAMAIALG